METLKKKFCLMTIGRAGSTTLMNEIVERTDALTPATLFSTCKDHELVHPAAWRGYARALGRHTGHCPDQPEQLVRLFYRLSSPSGLIGFKSMPNRHRGLDKLALRKDIQFISLTRADLPSTVASFMIARKKDTWRRQGGEQENLWTFRPSDEKRVQSNLNYILEGERRLGLISNCIRLRYEELCEPAFQNAQLDEFFGTRIALKNPRPPTTAASYVTNWSAFEAFTRAYVRTWEGARGESSVIK